MPLDPRYFTTQDLENYFVDKDTGAPLSGGFVRFWEDNNRLIPKNVYELQNLGGGPPPNYAYLPLPNPLQLSSVGTPMDNNGNNIAIYYYPFDAAGNQQLYYIEIFNSLGVQQFVREAWPNLAAQINPVNDNGANAGNAILNPQFIDVLFPPTLPLVIPYAGVGTTTLNIAYGWSLSFSYVNAGNMTVTRTPIAGNLQYPGNPPYTLTITPGPNITAVTLTQTLNNNPDIFAPAAGGVNGWLAGSILLAPGSSIIMSYQENGLGLQQILNVNNVAANYMEFDATVQLTPAANPNNADAGLVNIVLTLPIAAPTTFSNVQIVGLQSDQAVIYEQQTANQQRSLLFNYYNPLLQKKPIPSHLVGWDFPFNPAQFLGTTVGPLALGANTSFYAWDQTIIFQSATNGITVSRSASGNGALRATATNPTQMALIQYLPQAEARKILNDRFAVNVASSFGNPVVGAGRIMTISVYYTTDAALPHLNGAFQSLVATIGPTGKPLTFHGNWNEVPRSNLGNAQFTLPNVPTANPTNFYDFPFNGWDLLGAAGANTATFFAIVVGTAPMGAAEAIEFGSIGLMSGDIATRPAPKALNEYEEECFYYYQKSFNRATVPAQAVGAGTGEMVGVQANVSPNVTVGAIITFPVVMNAVPTVTLYNPMHANAELVSTNAPNDDYTATATSVSIRRIVTSGVPPVTSPDGAGAAIHYTADARLGL